jgi:hypothetical protein
MLKWTKSKIRKEERRPIAKITKNPQSPSSTFTFAALWDPDTGFTAYEKGKLLSPHKARDFAGHRPFNPSVDTSVSIFFFCVKFKSIGAEPHVRPYNSINYLRPLMPYTPCTGEGTPMVIIPPLSPVRKHRLEVQLLWRAG